MQIDRWRSDFLVRWISGDDLLKFARQMIEANLQTDGPVPDGEDPLLSLGPVKQ